MKAAVCRQFKAPLEIEDVTLGETQSGQLRVKLAACAICHSDLAFLDGSFGGHLPAVYGHEASGHVLEIGDGVNGVAVGDPVLVTLIRSCGTCASCATGHPTSCETPYDRVANSPLTDADGIALEQGMAAGAFAQEVLVDQSQIVKLPDDMDMAVASLLACGVITGFGAVTNSAKMPAGANVAVIGAGGVGLNTIQAAAICGANKVIAVDLGQEKLDAAVEFGATHALISDADLHDNIRALTDGRGVDYVFVTVGAVQAFNAAPDLLAPRGEVVMVGMPPVGVKAEYEPVNLAGMSQSMRGSKMGEAVLQRDIPQLIDLYRQGRLKLDELISNTYSLDQINDAIADTRKGVSRRNVILFDQ
ncbi:S-(hydroxymethyl)mycothiol dehydrogenase [Amylibacter ulvae]|uniref:S-(Hydroxymethyl)mycothiol dehydrogenase n=1 Tax=Paramylibacter ulvae TaxID=1651968 RepID=A0ABQ3CUT5_9RHOB|nr:Zn-dependent alcohol dehydrogenase [Amylibacter ulvae]GHA44945.1 S-(hydroxymethyl)mycothiol dehydrogenase [Amylibacter ulvae]